MSDMVHLCSANDEEHDMPSIEPTGLISMKECMRLLSVSSRSTVYGYMKQNPDFTRPCSLSKGRSRVRFKAVEVSRFIESLPPKE